MIIMFNKNITNWVVDYNEFVGKTLNMEKEKTSI